MRRVTVSVLMPAFNASRFIRQSVASVLGQTFEDFELLVIDDGSTGDTVAILEQMRDPRLRVLPNPGNLGIVASLNRGIGNVRGRYVARLDSDDICRPTRFARQVEFLERNPGVLLVGARMNDLEHGYVRPPKTPAEPDPQVLRWLFHLGNPVGASRSRLRLAMRGPPPPQCSS
ncbi:MAG: glycosyltransferase family 2 protein [Acetobacteraceae bacterium]